MSLYGMMRTGVSGMNAQANRLSSVADNIANSGTTGYKRSTTEFSTLVLPSTKGAYNSGGVSATIINQVSQQGVLQYTTSVTDLAVNGNGFFVVQDARGSSYLTRAGAFVPDAQGRLVNAAGYQLMAYPYSNGIPAATANGFEGLQPVVISDSELTASPSTRGFFAGNLSSDSAPVDAADLPTTNSALAKYSYKTSLVTYDNLGSKVLMDVYFTKTGDNTWQVTMFDQAGASAGTSFPYSSGPLGTANLTFDPATGKISGGVESITLTVPNGAELTLDLSKLSQLAAGSTITDAGVNGNSPSAIERIEISQDGTIYAQYADGTLKALYRVPLADVQSPDRLTVLPGNIFAQSTESGAVRIGFPREGKLGSIVSGALENSNVDIAEELTNMIEAQRSYTANSKVFQTGSDLMDVLVNLKR